MTAMEGGARDRDLDYLERRRVSPQWATFLAAVTAQLAPVAQDEEIVTFMRSVGARMARRHPSGALGTLEALESHINAVLTAMDWGWAQLTAAEDHILITHGASPNVLETDTRDAWPLLIAEVLAGAYEAWLAEQGSPGQVTTCRDPLARPLVFEHRV